jgi:hypothetical protein
VGSTPVLKPSEVADILRKLGFELVRQRGSHQQILDARSDLAQERRCDVAPPPAVTGLLIAGAGPALTGLYAGLVLLFPPIAGDSPSLRALPSLNTLMERDSF